MLWRSCSSRRDISEIGVRLGLGAGRKPEGRAVLWRIGDARLMLRVGEVGEEGSEDAGEYIMCRTSLPSLPLYILHTWPLWDTSPTLLFLLHAASFGHLSFYFHTEYNAAQSGS